jgi:hypothetical protein
MAAFPDRSEFDSAQTRRGCLTPQTRKISPALINNPFGKNCLVLPGRRADHEPGLRSRRRHSSGKTALKSMI